MSAEIRQEIRGEYHKLNIVNWKQQYLWMERDRACKVERVLGLEHQARHQWEFTCMWQRWQCNINSSFH